MNVKILFALFVCLCLFVSVSSVCAMDVDEGIDDSQSDVINIDDLNDKEAQDSFGDANGEIDVILPESTGSDKISKEDQTDSDMGDKDLSDDDGDEITVYKYVIKRPYHQKFTKDSKRIACMYRYHFDDVHFVKHMSRY